MMHSGTYTSKPIQVHVERPTEDTTTPHVPGYLEDVESYLPGEVQLEKQLGRGPILGSLGGADNPIYHRVLRQPELRILGS